MTVWSIKLQLNKPNSSDTEAPFLDLHLTVTDGFVSSKNYDNRDDFDLYIVNFLLLDGDILHRTSYGLWTIYISTHSASHVADFNSWN